MEPGGPLAAASAFLRSVRQGLEGGSELAEALTRSAEVLPDHARWGARTLARRLQGEYCEDEWGFDEDFVRALWPLLDFLYDSWWRVRATGTANVPSTGGAILAANHAGILPWDATMIGVAILRDHPQPRYPRFLVLDWAFELPYVSVVMRKVGGVVASPHNALRLLREERLVAAFPEGVMGTGKPFAERYRLRRFGRGGFVEVALRTGAPIVPVAVVGSEEIYPKIGEAPLLARLTGAPFFPLTPTFPWLGPLGAVPLPSKWRIEFCEPIETARYGPEAAEDRALILELSDHVRDTVQQKLYENLVARGHAFL